MKKIICVFALYLGIAFAPEMSSAQGVLGRLSERLDQLEADMKNLSAQQRTLQRLQRQLQNGQVPVVSGDLKAEVDVLQKKVDGLVTSQKASDAVIDRVAELESGRIDVVGLVKMNEGLTTEVADLRQQIQSVVSIQNKKQEQSNSQIKIGGQIRPRFEARNVGVDNYNMATTMRARTHVEAKLQKDVRVFVQLQDVRTWGEETNTLGDFRADNFDLHQGYIELKNMHASSVSMRMGRQAIALGGQRLIGAVEWTQQGRVFDGLRLTTATQGGRVDLIGLKLAEASVATVNNDAYLFGVYGQITQPKDVDIELYGLYNRVEGVAKTSQFTLGSRLLGKSANWDYRLEASYQTGKRAGRDVEAYMLGGRMGVTFAQGKSKITLWYDYLSGDDDLTDTKIKVFDTLFATNHKFYGFADLFLNIPVHTAERGLHTAALKMMFKPRQNISLGIDLHTFWLAQQTGISSKRLADEADVTLRYQYSPNVSFVGGYSYVIARDGFAQIGRFTKDIGFGYLMTNVVF